MEEPIFHHLLNIVVYQLAANLFQVISIIDKRLIFIQPVSFDILHDQHVKRCIFLVEHRGADVGNSFISAGKLFHICRFCQEIHLLARYRPQFIQNHVQIHHAFEADRRQKLYCFVEEADIPCHRLIDSLALNLHHDFASIAQYGLVHLRNRG